MEALTRLNSVDPDYAELARADLALYEGRLDDAAGLLEAQIARTVANHTPGLNMGAYIRLGTLLLRRGDSSGAATAALQGKSGSGGIRGEYEVASLLIETGHAEAVVDITRKWAERSGRDGRMFERLVQGDVLRHAGNRRGAVLAYRDAILLLDSWLAHERLGVAYLEQGAWDDAERELSLCIARRAEGAIWMTPSLGNLTHVY